MKADDIEDVLSNTLMPHSVKYTLVLVSITKRALADDLSDHYRFQFLQHLDKMVDPIHWITAEMIAAVKPCDDKGAQLFFEASKVDPKKKLDVYAEIFGPMAALNPSLITAIKMSNLYRNAKGGAHG